MALAADWPVPPAPADPEPEDDPSTPVRTMLVDDHALFRWGVRDLLDRSGIEVVAEAGEVEEAVEAAVRERPQVVLMDLRLQAGSGIEAIRRILALEPEIRIVVLSVSSDASDVVQAIEAGACGYLLKGIRAEDLVAAIRSAARGEDPIAPTVARALLTRVRTGRTDVREADRIRELLTARELQILTAVAGGASIAEIAPALGISAKTARNHLSNLLGKLGLANRVQATLYAVRAGLLDDAPGEPGSD